MKRSSPMARGTKPLKRLTRLKARGQHGTRFPKTRDLAYRAWIRSLSCLAFDCGMAGCGAMPGRRKVEPAHIKTWATSGLDHGNIVPLCPVHHDEQEGKTAAFEKRLGVELATMGSLYFARYQQQESA